MLGVSVRGRGLHFFGGGAGRKIDAAAVTGDLYNRMNTEQNSTIIVSLDGNIGAGKSTLMEKLRVAMPEVDVVVEPVGEWMRLRNAEGRSLLELFYEDKRRWAYTFQNCAVLTRLRSAWSALGAAEAAGKRVIIMERSVLTDRFVFAEMLRASGDIDALEWDMYMKWYDTFIETMPIRGIIYLSTDVATSAARCRARGRPGEEAIPLSYLEALDAQHDQWLQATDLPVLNLSTAEGSATTVADHVAAIREFLGTLPRTLPRSLG